MPTDLEWHEWKPEAGFLDGTQAYEDGVAESDNPFPEGSSGFSGWNAGWNEARYLDRYGMGQNGGVPDA